MEAIGRKRLFPGDDGTESHQPKKFHISVRNPPEMTQQMNHFKLTGSPKRKNYVPRRRLADQYTMSATRTATTQATIGHETSGAISCTLFKCYMHRNL